MSGNHYRKQVIQLETILQQKQAQADILQAENSLLKQREWALQSCILGIAGSVAATRAVLEVEVDTGHSFQTTQSCYSEDTSTSCSWQSAGDGDSTSCGAAAASAALYTRGHSMSPAQNVLLTLQATEQQVQAVYAGLGCCGTADAELYGTRLLRKVTADPVRALTLLSTPLPERRRYLQDELPRMGLLLPKYDSSAPTTSLGSPKEQLHAVVDELVSRLLLTALADRPEMRLSNMMVNLETMQPEKYPEGYWKPVVVSLQLTDDQKAALKMCWARVKANTTALTEQHGKLEARLKELQQQQEQLEQECEARVAQLLALDAPASLNHSYSGEQSKQLPRQQWQAPVAAQQVQQACGMQVQQLEQEIQDIEQILFPDLAIGGQEPGSMPVWPECLQPNGSLCLDESWSALLGEQEQVDQLGELQMLLQADQTPLQERQQQQEVQPRQRLHMTYLPFVNGVEYMCSSRETELSPSFMQSTNIQQQQQQQQSCDTQCACDPPLPQLLQQKQQQPVQELQRLMQQLQAASKGQRETEARLLTVTEKLKMQHFCQMLQFHNLLTYKQMAELYVSSWPFLPDEMSMCGALDEMDWETAAAQ